MPMLENVIEAYLRERYASLRSLAHQDRVNARENDGVKESYLRAADSNETRASEIAVVFHALLGDGVRELDW